MCYKMKGKCSDLRAIVKIRATPFFILSPLSRFPITKHTRKAKQDGGGGKINDKRKSRVN